MKRESTTDKDITKKQKTASSDIKTKATTTIKTEHPFFDMKKSIKWVTSLETVLIAKTKGSEVSKNKVAAFDLDGTLITTKSGNTYAKNESDWKWWHASVPQKIKSLHNEGFKIVVFSNQNGLNSEKKINSFKYKIETILGQMEEIPVIFLAALKKDKYRKPMTGMWDWFVENNKEPIDKSLCFYVGDAAGRQANWKPNYKKDHSCCDRKFADNIQIDFFTPEEYFLNEPKAEFHWGGFHPKQHLTLEVPLYTPDAPLVVKEPELIVCVGYPASGKSSFVKTHIVPHGYVYVNQDTLKTKEKCVKACRQALSEGKSVVIDNTNPEASTRQLYIKLAKDANVPVRCFYFGDNEDLAQHNNYYRALYKSAEKRDVLSIIAYRTFKSRLQEPTTQEGYTEVKRIQFKFDSTSSSKQDIDAWSQWWV